MCRCPPGWANSWAPHRRAFGRVALSEALSASDLSVGESVSLGEESKVARKPRVKSHQATSLKVEWWAEAASRESRVGEAKNLEPSVLRGEHERGG